MLLLSHTTWQAVMREMRLVRSEKHDIKTANSNGIILYPQQIRVKVNCCLMPHQECLSSHPGTVKF